MSDQPFAGRRLEIVHESLLSSWPRLVRWRAQDAEGAQLRDDLRQAAEQWARKGRSDDLLWTGTSFKEFELWRERYPGGLSAREEAFVQAMRAMAGRRRLRRRLALAAVGLLLLGVAAVLAIFWRRSESARWEAVAAERQAQASNLYGLARMQPEEEPTAFLAYATASLEQVDNAEVRREIVRALWKGPPGFRLPEDSRQSLDFSPDGRWLATASREEGVRLWPADGGQPLALEGSTPSATETSAPEATAVRFSPEGDILAHTRPTEGTTVSQSRWREVALWSVPQGQLLRSLEFDDGDTRWFSFASDGAKLFTLTEIQQGEILVKEIRSWPLSGGEPTLLARLEIDDSRPFGFTVTEVDPTGTRLVWTEGGRLFLAHLDGSEFDPQLATEIDHPGAVAAFSFDRRGIRLATGAFEDDGVTLRIWTLDDGAPRLERTLVARGVEAFPYLDATATRLFQMGAGMWDLRGPPDSAPLPLRFADRLIEGDVGFGTAVYHPNGRWVATGNTASVSFWPLARPYPHILSGHEGEVMAVRYTLDGRWLVSAGSDGTIRLWPLDPAVADRSRILHQTEAGRGAPNRLALPPDGSFIAFSTVNGQVAILPLAGGPLRELRGFNSLITALSVGPRGRLVAAGAGYGDKQESVVRVWDLQTGQVHVLDYGNPERVFVNQTRFTPEGDLLVEAGQYLRWDLRTDPPRVVREGMRAGGLVRDFSPDGRWALTTAGGFGPLAVEDLETGTSRALVRHAPSTNRAIFDPSGMIVISATSYPNGPISVGPVSGEEPHLLFGHESVGQEGLVGIDALAVSPDGRWIASGGEDGTIRLWPMPDLAQPPLQTLPTAELVAKLRTLTNLQVVPEPDSFTGWKLEIGPFPGWDEVPTW